MCLSHLIYTVRPCLIHTCHAMPCPCHAPTMPFFSMSRHSTAAERRPVGYLPAFGFFSFDLHSAAVSDSHLPCHAQTMPFFSRSRHSTAVERRSVGYLPAFGFFGLPRGVPRRLLSEAYQSQMQVASVKPNNVCRGRGKEW
jgi:hypothetical protein